MKLMARIDRGAPYPLFVTLTYPEEYPDVETAKRHLRAWLMRLKRAAPRAGWVWRMEFQERGAPHFHLLIWGVPFLDKEWVSRTWYEVVSSGDPKHLRAGTRVERVWSWRGVLSYAAKYMTKDDDGPVPEWTGRVWGYGGNLPLASVVVLALSWRDLVQFIRAVRRFTRWRNVRLGRGGWFFSSSPRMWLRLALVGPPAEVAGLA